MSLGKRKHEQQAAWVATTDLPKSPGHPFYHRLNQILAEAGFDAWLEQLCHPYYADQKGRPSIPPGTYFRMILIGYFEGLASQRGIAWRCCDSRSLAEFLGYSPAEETPDHSSLTPFISGFRRKSTPRCSTSCSSWPRRSSCSTAKRWPSIRRCWRPTPR